MKKAIQIAIGLLFSAIFAYLAVKDVQWERFFATLRQNKEWWYLLPSVLLFTSSFIFRALRWKYLLEPVKEISFPPLFSAVMIGYMGNNVLPVRLGEFLRAYVIGRSTDISKSAGFATIVVERLTDMIGLLIFLFIAILGASIPRRYSTIVLIVGLVAGILLLLFLALTFYEERTNRFLGKLFRFFPNILAEKLTNITQSFVQGLRGLKQTQNYLRILFHTLMIWTVYAGSAYYLIQAFNFDVQYQMGFIAGIVLFIFGTIGVMVPSSPGYIGTFHYAIIQGLALYGVPDEPALGFAIIMHLSNYIPITSLGIFFFLREGFRFKEVTEAAKKTDSKMQ